MKKLNALLLAALLMMGTFGRAHASVEVATPKDADTSEQARVLVARFNAAHKAHDIEALMSLVFWKDVTPQTQDSMRKAFQDLLQKQIKNVFVGPVPSDQMTEYTMGSVHYRLNLKPVGVLQIFVSTATDGIVATSFVVGVNGKGYSIATAAPAP